MDIGGVSFWVKKAVLMAVEGYFSVALNWSPIPPSGMFVDRDPTHFQYILTYLEKMHSGDPWHCLDYLLIHGPWHRSAIYREAQFYCYTELCRQLREEPCQYGPPYGCKGARTCWQCYQSLAAGWALEAAIPRSPVGPISYWDWVLVCSNDCQAAVEVFLGPYTWWWVDEEQPLCEMCGK